MSRPFLRPPCRISIAYRLFAFVFSAEESGPCRSARGHSEVHVASQRTEGLSYLEGCVWAVFALGMLRRVRRLPFFLVVGCFLLVFYMCFWLFVVGYVCVFLEDKN